MKALTVKQPWAGLIASGQKTIETRTHRTHYRGPLLICASKPQGIALCIVDIIACRPMAPGDWKAACCDSYPNAFGWIIGKITPVSAFAVRGMPGIFEIEPNPEIERILADWPQPRTQSPLLFAPAR